MKRRLTSVSILLPALVLWLAGAALAQASGASKRLAADFQMERTLTALADKIASSGKLYLGGPGLLRWEMTAPSRSLLVVNQGQAWIHYPDLDITKGFDLAADPVMRVMSEHLLVLTSGEFDRVGELYVVSDIEGGAKRLLPREAAVKNVFQELRVKIGAAGVIAWVELVSAGGDLTRIEFNNVKVDPDLDPALFQRPGK
jgi:outer membrane lipoprotein-sorting protein